MGTEKGKRESKKLAELGGFWITEIKQSKNLYLAWYDPEKKCRQSKSLGTPDLHVAIKLLAEHVATNGQMRDEAASDVRIETILIRYWDQHGKKLPSWDAIKMALGLWTDFFSGKTVGDLTVAAQEDFIEWLRTYDRTTEGRYGYIQWQKRMKAWERRKEKHPLEKPPAPKIGYEDRGISRILSVGRAALNRARRRQEVAWVPDIIDIRWAKKATLKLNIRDLVKVFDSIDEERHPHVLTYAILACCTMGRPDAILDLKKEYVDFENRILDTNPPGRVQTKKRRPLIPVCNTLLPWLRKAEAGYLITYGSSESRIGSIKNAMEGLRIRTGIDGFSAYTLRRTMAKELRRRGVPQWEVKGFLGHVEPGPLEDYAEFAPDFLGHAAKAIDDIMQEVDQQSRQQIILKPKLVQKLG